MEFVIDDSAKAAIVQNDKKGPNDSVRPSSDIPQLIDPGFESFNLARGPIFGWYSDDVTYPTDARYASVTMTPDSKIKVEGQYSLRIEQIRPRPKEWGQAYLAQAVWLPKQGAVTRQFDLAAQMRGGLNGPVSIEIYVWDPSDIAGQLIARRIAHRDVKVNRDWKITTVSFKVPGGYDQFGIWFYIPRDDEAQLWLDDVRLTPRIKARYDIEELVTNNKIR